MYCLMLFRVATFMNEVQRMANVSSATWYMTAFTHMFTICLAGPRNKHDAGYKYSYFLTEEQNWHI